MVSVCPSGLPALGAWKPAKDAGFHIPTATATAAAKSDKLPNPRQSHVIPDSCAEPEKGTARQLLDAEKWDFVVLQECTLVIRKYVRAKSK